MGINILENRAVIFDSSHDYRLITHPNKNPKISRKNKLEIASIYRRTKTGDFKRDGNPFIYALKNKNGYHISRQEIIKFYPSFYTILNKTLQGQTPDFVLSMPSSHPITTLLTKRVAKKAGAIPIYNYFDKITIGQVISNFDFTQVRRNHIKLVKSQLATYQKINPSNTVSLKSIPNKIRQYFQPLMINSAYQGEEIKGNILLVDDLLSTGTTLVCARNYLLSKQVTKIKALCLLSDL